MTDYQFYLLFRKSLLKRDEYLEEPRSLPSSIYEDQDQRLFCFHLHHPDAPLTSEQLCRYLFNFWQEIRPFYQNCLVHDTPNTTLTREGSEELFLGGILLIIDDPIEAKSHTLRLPLCNDEDLEIGEAHFLPPSNLENSSLLNLCDKDNQNASSARFINFEVKLHINNFQERKPFFQWQLKFNPHRAYLMPIQKGGHPVLKVYGLLRGEIATWEDRLADFLVYRQSPVLPTLMSLLLRHQWQDRDIYMRTTQWITTLENKDRIYRQKDEPDSIENLQRELQKLEHLSLETKDLLIIIERTFKLSSYDDVMSQMYVIQNDAQREGWVVDWHWQQEIKMKLLQVCFPNVPSQPTYPALLHEAIHHQHEMETLKNSLEDQLRHLEGHRLFLNMSLKEQERMIKEKLIAVGYSTVLSLVLMMLVVAGVKGLFQDYIQCCCVNCWYLHVLGAILENPLVYFIFILIALTPIFQQEWKFHREKHCNRETIE